MPTLLSPHPALIPTLAMFLGYGAYYFVRVHFSVASNSIISDSFLTSEDYGTIVAYGYVMGGVGKIVMGIILDSWLGQTKNIFIGCLFVSAACCYLFTVFTDIFILTCLWCLNRWVQAAGWGAVVKMVVALWEKEYVGRVLGLGALSYCFAEAVVRLILSASLEIFAWRQLFYLSCFCACLLMVPAIMLIPSAPSSSYTVIGASAISSQSITSAVITALNNVLILIKQLSHKPQFYLIMLLGFGLTSLRETFSSWTPLYLHSVLGLSQVHAGYSSMIFPIFGGISAVFGGHLMDKLIGGPNPPPSSSNGSTNANQPLLSSRSRSSSNTSINLEKGHLIVPNNALSTSNTLLAASPLANNYSPFLANTSTTSSSVVSSANSSTGSPSNALMDTNNNNLSLSTSSISTSPEKHHQQRFRTTASSNSTTTPTRRTQIHHLHHPKKPWYYSKALVLCIFLFGLCLGLSALKDVTNIAVDYNLTKPSIPELPVSIPFTLFLLVIISVTIFAPFTFVDGVLLIDLLSTIPHGQKGTALIIGLVNAVGYIGAGWSSAWTGELLNNGGLGGGWKSVIVGLGWMGVACFVTALVYVWIEKIVEGGDERGGDLGNRDVGNSDGSGKEKKSFEIVNGDGEGDGDEEFR